jgi:hypothetical protein
MDSTESEREREEIGERAANTIKIDHRHSAKVVAQHCVLGSCGYKKRLPPPPPSTMRSDEQK